MENLPTIIVASVVAVIFLVIVIRGIRNKIRGKHTCSCGCSNCTLNCHGETK